MALKEFIGKVVIKAHSGERCILTEITAPEICIASVALGPYGTPRHYAYETINGDPLSEGTLVFEDSSLLEPFKAAYTAYCRTEDAYWEIYGYYMRKD